MPEGFQIACGLFCNIKIKVREKMKERKKNIEIVNKFELKKKRK